MLSSFFLALGNFVVQLAELFFAKKPQNKFENRNASSSAGGNNHNNKHANQLKEALAFFENTSLNDNDKNTEHLERVRESVKKQFRKLSLIHHPDRNDNSPESVVMMQKINHYYTVINEELDRRLGIHHDDSDDDDKDNDGDAAAESARNQQQQRPSSSHQQHQQHQQQSAPPSRSGFTSRKQAAKKARLAQREAAKKASHAQRQADKEMKEMESLYKRQRAQVRRQQQVEIKMAQQKVQRYDLETELGRRSAHEAWQKAQVQAQQQQSAATEEAAAAADQQVPFSQRASSPADSDGDSTSIPPMHSASSSSLHDIDYDDHDINSGTTTTTEEQTQQLPEDTTKSKKAKNAIMDCCTNEVVVAMRMGMSEAAMTCLSDKMQVYVHNYVLVHRPRDLASLQEYVHQAGRCFLTNRTTFWLDGDNNTYLHYAVYYENGDLVDMIYSLACKFNVLVETFLCKNAHGLIPLDYYYCYSDDCSSTGIGSRTANFDDDDNNNNNNAYLGRKIKTLTDLARDARDAQPGWPKTTRRFRQVIQNMDLVSILNGVACVLVGKLVFGTSILVSVGLATAAMWFCRDNDDDGFNKDNEYSVPESLFLYHIVFWVGRGLYILVRLPSPWEVAVLVALACSGRILTFAFPTMIRPVTGRTLLFMVVYLLNTLTWLFQTMRRRLVLLTPALVTKMRLQDLEVLFVFSMGCMGVQWLLLLFASSLKEYPVV